MLYGGPNQAPEEHNNEWGHQELLFLQGNTFLNQFTLLLKGGRVKNEIWLGYD